MTEYTNGAPVSVLVAEGAAAAKLWQQRFFEGATGMTNYLIRRNCRTSLLEWIRLQSSLYADLPEPGRDPDAWQRVFFRAQALMERFLVRYLGHAEIARWTAASAEVFAIVEEDTGSGAADVVDRLRRQLENYGSDVEVTETGRTFAAIRVHRCGI